MVAVRQVEIQFQLEYNTSVDEFLDSIYAAGADLGDSQIEEWAKALPAVTNDKAASLFCGSAPEKS
mgnify:CR=1 FL=1